LVGAAVGELNLFVRIVVLSDSDQDELPGYVKPRIERMATVLFWFFLMAVTSARVEDLNTLEHEARLYVWAMEAALALPKNSPKSEVINKAKEYAAAKIAYYDAARTAMPALLESAKSETTDNPVAKELAEIFKDFGEDEEAQADAALKAALDKRDKREQSDETTQAKAELARAQEVAEQFVQDFGKLQGV
jgi:hypothetical protein